VHKTSQPWEFTQSGDNGTVRHRIGGLGVRGALDLEWVVPASTPGNWGWGAEKQRNKVRLVDVGHAPRSGKPAFWSAVVSSPVEDAVAESQPTLRPSVARRAWRCGCPDRNPSPNPSPSRAFTHRNWCQSLEAAPSC